jgi:hypothetical protein
MLTARFSQPGSPPAERHRIRGVDVIGGTGLAGQGQAAGDVVVVNMGLEYVRHLDASRGRHREDPADIPLRHLLEAGLARPDPLRLGLDTDSHGALRDANGRPAGDIFTLGPLLRGSRYETTAVPEIRGQAEALARLLLAGQWAARPGSAA